MPPRQIKTKGGFNSAPLFTPDRTVSMIGHIVAAAILLLFFFSSWSDYQQAIKMAFSRATNDTRVFEEYTLRTLNAIDILLLGEIDRIEEQPEAAFSVNNSYDLRLAKLAESVPALWGIIVLDKDGDLMFDSKNNKGTSPGLSNRDFFKAHKADQSLQFHISSPFIDRLTGKWFFGISQRLNSSDGEFRGVIMAIVLANFAEPFLEDFRSCTDCSYTLISDNGTILANEPSETGLGSNVFQSSLFTSHLSLSKSGAYETTDASEGETYILAYSKSKNYPLIATVSRSLSEALNEWRQQINHRLIVSILGVLLSIGLGQASAKQIRTQKRAVEQAAAREAAEISNASKTEFLANMSHELRTPLNSIIGFAEILQSTDSTISDEKRFDYYESIRGSGEHLLHIINDILDLSKIGADRMPVIESPFHINQVVESSLKLVAQKALTGEITLVNKVREDLPLLNADERKTKQMLLNLLSNAIKFTPKGGTVTVSAAVDGRGGLNLTVTDNGIGMSEAETQLALDKFRQIDSSLAREHSGTGLGLPLVKGLIELHGGSFTLKSVKGNGTEVTLRFPKKRVLAAT